MSRRSKAKNWVTLIGLLREKQEGFGLQPFFGPMGVTMVQKKVDRGVLSCQVFNLRPQRDKTGKVEEYGIWLGGQSGERDYFIPVGNLKPGISGQGGGQWEFNPANVQGSGHSLEEFDRVVIAVTGSQNPKEPGNVIPLEGKLEQPGNYLSPQMPGIAGMSGITGMAGIPGVGGVPGMSWFAGISGMPGIPVESSIPGPPDIPGIPAQVPADTNRLSLYQLIGLTLDQEGTPEYLVHGIPGRFNQEDQPQQGKTGYVYWHLAAQQEEHPDLGYWLVYLDPKTNQVVFPEPIPPGPNN